MSGSDPVLVAFGLSIINLRKEKGLTQEGLAGLAGIDRSYMGHIERGDKNITLTKICQISKALNVSPSQLLFQLPPNN